MTTRIDPSLLARIPALILPLNRLSAMLQKLDPNHILQGRVLAVRGSQMVISLLGEQITAESLLPLQVGQALDLVVRELLPDRITLQVAQQTGEGAPVIRVITDQDLNDLLAAQHLPPDHANLLIARTLLRNSLPITRAIVLEARNALSFIEAPHADDVEATIFLILKELPVTRESLELAKSALLQPNNLGARVQALATQLVELLAYAEQTEQGRAATVLPRHIQALAHQLLQELPLLAPDLAQGRAFAALVRQVLDQIGTPTEGRLARLLEEGAHDLAGQGAPEPVTIAAGESQPADPEVPEQDVSQLNGRRQEATIPALSPKMLPEEPRQAPLPLMRQYPPAVTHDFRRQLASMNDALTQVSAELPTHHRLAPLLGEIGTAIREMITMVEAEQLSNAGLPPPTQPQGYYVFNLPMAVTGQDVTDTAEVQIYYQRRDHTKRIDPENAHLAFLLQMSHLGPVDVHVDLYQKHLRCRIECSNREATDLFEESSSELRERLQEVGYSVDSIRTVIADEPHAPPERASIPSLFRIDIRA